MSTTNEMNRLIMNEYLTYITHVRKMSPHTIISYTQHITKFIEFLEEIRLPITEVSSKEAIRFLSLLIKERMAKATINSYLASYKSLYRYLVSHNKIEKNPFLSIESNPRVRKLPNYLTLEEVSSLLSCEITDLISLRDITIFSLFYATGCRMSELLNMNFQDVDSTERRIKVLGKGNKPRYLFLTPKAFQLLTLLKESRATWILMHPIRQKEDEDAIFLSVGGKRLSPSSLHSIFTMYRVKLGFSKRFTPHVLRHSFATHMMNNEAPIQLVSELLGHASLSTTQIYTHITTDRLKEVYSTAHPHGRNKNGNTRNNDHSSEKRK